MNPTQLTLINTAISLFIATFSATTLFGQVKTPTHSHVSYGPEERQWLNLYLPSGSKPAPVFIYAHPNGSTADYVKSSWANPTLAEGTAIVSWESIAKVKGMSDFRTCAADAKVMFAWVKENAATYNFDIDKIFIGGQSRGSFVSWELAHSLDAAIVGIYMGQALPGSSFNERLLEPITESAPPIFLAYRKEPGVVGDIHDPAHGLRVLEKYKDLGIGDRAELVHSLSDTSDSEVMQFLPKFVRSVLKATSGEGNPLEKQILKLQPQADTNGDGKLSKEEEAALNERILKRFPQADADGDGTLSLKEQRALWQLASTRAKRQGGQAPSPKADKTDGQNPPTHANVKYGDHERQVFDIWLAESETPTPLAIYIHGGGFRAGSKEKFRPNERDKLLEAGISVAAINYRYMSVDTPLPTPHHDARRALQTMRSKAEEWNIDKERIAAFGGSAGAQICMWLAYSDEMANPDSEDPIERESTRLTCVATSGGQTTNSAEYWKNLFTSLLGPDIDTKGFSRPLGDITDPEQARIAMWGAETLEEAEGIASRHSALSLISADDPPIFMSYFMSPTAKPPTEKDRIRGWVIHHVNFGLTLKEKTDALEVEAHLKYPGTETPYSSQIEFFVDKLLKE